MVLQRPMLIWRRGGVSLHRYMCILLYVKLTRCNGVAQIYALLEEGVGPVCHRYMLILLYVKLIGVYVHSSTCESYAV